MSTPKDLACPRLWRMHSVLFSKAHDQGCTHFSYATVTWLLCAGLMVGIFSSTPSAVAATVKYSYQYRVSMRTTAILETLVPLYYCSWLGMTYDSWQTFIIVLGTLENLLGENHAWRMDAIHFSLFSLNQSRSVLALCDSHVRPTNLSRVFLASTGCNITLSLFV